MDFRGQIQAKREAAAQARRIAISMVIKEDVERILAFAADLDAQADRLDREYRRSPSSSQSPVQMTPQGGTNTSGKPRADCP